MTDRANDTLADFVRETGCDVAASLAGAAPAGFSTDYETLTLDWQGIALSVRFCADWCRSWCEVYGDCLGHIEVRSPNRQPLPISETGSRGLYVSASILAEWGGPLPYVQAMLDAEAKSWRWIEAQKARRQLSLF